jgi:hypothetical protein
MSSQKNRNSLGPNRDGTIHFPSEAQEQRVTIFSR